MLPEGMCKDILELLPDGVYFVDPDRRITYWNRAAESISGYPPGMVVGSRCRDNILMHVDENGKSLCDGACPLSDAMATGEQQTASVYLHHRQGHRVPVWVRTAPLRDERGELIGAVEVFQDRSPNLAMAERLQQLERMALLDPLTRLANRGHTEANLQIRLEELTRYEWPFGVLFVDIDHFKKINDRHGHPVGDKLLRLVSMTLLNSLRPFDFLGRWGGDEFVAIVINVSVEQLARIAERSRRLVAQTTLSTGTVQVPVTVSVGATMARRSEGLAGLIARADRLMYRSKSAGRNRVSFETDPGAN